MTTAQRLQNIMARQAALMTNASARPRTGVITGYKKSTYCVKVKLQPGGTETGWIPLGSPWTGNGWGMFAPPKVGDQCRVLFEGDSVDVGFAVCFVYNTTNAPLSVAGGECWLVHKTGSYIKLKNSGRIQIHSTTEVDVGDISATLLSFVTSAFLLTYNSHTHEVVDGTAMPTENIMTAEHLTQMVKGN